MGQERRELISVGINGGPFQTMEITAGSTLTRSNPTLLFPNFVGLSRNLNRRRNYDVTADGERFVVLLGTTGVAEAVDPRINIVLNWFEELNGRVPVP